jgi:hypothetical protein
MYERIDVPRAGHTTNATQRGAMISLFQANIQYKAGACMHACMQARQTDRGRLFCVFLSLSFFGIEFKETFLQNVRQAAVRYGTVPVQLRADDNRRTHGREKYQREGRWTEKGDVYRMIS